MNGKILVSVCGVGDPNFDKKIIACKNNIETITKTAPSKYKDRIDFVFYAYDDRLTNELNDYNNCNIVREPGFVGEFIYRHLQQHVVKRYDRIIVMLDDVNIQPNFNLEKIISIQDKYDFDIISPTLTTDSKASHPFMKTRRGENINYILSTSFVEFFMYVMKPSSEAYAKWLSCFDQQTKCMWGIDMILNAELGLKLGLVNNMMMKHMYKGGSVKNGFSEMKRLLSRINDNHRKHGSKSPVPIGDLRDLSKIIKVLDKKPI